MYGDTFRSYVNEKTLAGNDKLRLSNYTADPAPSLHGPFTSPSADKP